MTHGSEKRARSAVLTIRLSTEEHAVIDANAERAGLTLASYGRSTLLGATAPRQVRRPVVERRELVRLLGEVGRVGNNLNQVAHHLNTGIGVPNREVHAVLDQLLDVRSAILSALGREP